MLTTVQVAGLTDPPVTRFTVVREIRRGHLKAEEPEGGGYWQIDPAEAARWAKTFVPYRTQRGPGGPRARTVRRRAGTAGAAAGPPPSSPGTAG